MGQLLPCRRVDHHVFDIGHTEIVADRIDRKAHTLPEKIVVMGNGRQLCFRHHFGQGQPQGDVHGNRQHIFGNQQVEFETFDEFIQPGF